MYASELLHYAFRSRDPLKLAMWYSELFDAPFFMHPVMSPLGIVILKLNSPQAVFRGLIEFWPWDVVWDGRASVFRRVPSQPSPTSYGHLAVKVNASIEAILEELAQRGVPSRLEPRAPGFLIPVIDDPEGNMIELFPDIDHMPVPPEAFCSRDHVVSAMEALRKRFDERMARVPAEEGIPLMLFDSTEAPRS